MQIWQHNLKDFQLSTLKSAITFLFPRCHCTIITRLVNYTTLTRLEAPTHHHQWPDQKRILGLMGEYEVDIAYDAIDQIHTFHNSCLYMYHTILLNNMLHACPSLLCVNTSCKGSP